MLKILVGTNNYNKVVELKEMFSDSKIEFILPKDLNLDIEINENGKSYEENAIIKAKEYSKYTDLPILSEDSGIEIEEMGKNYPGIFSKRYSEKFESEKDMCNFLSEKYHNSNCKYVCSLILFLDKNIYSFKGEVFGKVAQEPIYKNNFGYDPIFYMDKFKTTLSNVDLNEKNNISHRFIACSKLKKFLKKRKFI